MLRGIVGGVTVGLMVGLIYGLIYTFSYISRWSLAKDWTFRNLSFFILNSVLAMTFDGTIRIGLPVGLATGLSSGILAATFGYNCPNLIAWLVLSWIGGITGFELGVFLFYGWTAYNILFGITLISLTASGLSYQATIHKIKKGVSKQASRRYTLLASLSHVMLIFTMLCPYFFLTTMFT